MVSYLPMQKNNIELFAERNPKHCFAYGGSKALHSSGVPVHTLGRAEPCGPGLSCNAAPAMKLDPKEWRLFNCNCVQSLAKRCLHLALIQDVAEISTVL